MSTKEGTALESGRRCQQAPAFAASHPSGNLQVGSPGRPGVLMSLLQFRARCCKFLGPRASGGTETGAKPLEGKHPECVAKLMMASNRM